MGTRRSAGTCSIRGRRDAPLLFAVVFTALLTVVTLLQLGLSRSREYDADLEAAVLTGDPDGLASALRQLKRAERRIWERVMVPRRRTPDPLLLRTSASAGDVPGAVFRTGSLGRSRTVTEAEASRGKALISADLGRSTPLVIRENRIVIGH